MTRETGVVPREDDLALLKRVRDPARLRSSKLLAGALEDVRLLPSPDPALIVGEGTLGTTRVRVFAQEKQAGASARAAVASNYGMMRTAGYALVARSLRMMATLPNPPPVLSLIDTPGADPSRPGEGLLARAISDAIAAYGVYPGPTLSVIIGEGGSGGALALQIADHRVMASDAMYSLLSPESCGAILFRSASETERSMSMLRPSARDALGIGAIDEILEWTGDAAARIAVLRSVLSSRLAMLCALDPGARVRDRIRRVMACGQIPDASDAWTRPAPTWRSPEPMTSSRFEVVERSRDWPEGGLCCVRSDGGCGATFSRPRFVAASNACPECGRGERMGASEWLRLLVDPTSFEELYPAVDLADVPAARDTESYRAAREAARGDGAVESLRVGLADVEGVRCAMAICDFHFLGGTLGAVAGEKLRRLCALAIEQRLPIVTVVCSGGARLQEGTLGLLQMAKTTLAVREAVSAGLPVICILADPCTGGALGSYATSGTVTLAEPHALVAFAGPKVMKLAGLRIDERQLDSNYLADLGLIDEVVPRARMRKRIARYLEICAATPTERPTLMRKEAGEAQAAMRRRLAELVDHIANTVLEDRWDGRALVAGEALRSEAVSRLAELALVTIPALIGEASQDTQPRVRAAALEALARFPASELELVEHSLEDAHHRVRASAAVALLTASPSHRAAIEAVEGLLSDPDPTVRRAGLFVGVRVRLPQLRARVIELGASDDPRERLLSAIVLANVGELECARAIFGAARIAGDIDAAAYVARWIAGAAEPLRETVESLLRDSRR